MDMATLPAFPDDVPIAPLLKISMTKLMSGDAEEARRMSLACEDIGFFYMDLTDWDSAVLSDVASLYQVGKKLFELSLTEKKQYDFSGMGSYFGYKHAGASPIDDKGNLDRNEFYNVSKDDIYGIGKRWPAPTILEENRNLYRSIMASCNDIVQIVLKTLNTSLGLPDHTFQKIHAFGEPSGDQVRIIRAPPQPMDDRRTALGAHTDYGSITVLFNQLGGLQILPPGESSEWCYVKPLPGHAIINMGDAMVKFSNGLLRSNIHRVFSPPGAQADCTRYSIAYFNRPNDNVLLKRLDGSNRIPPLADGVVEEPLTSQDWTIKRGLGRLVAMAGRKEYEGAEKLGTENISMRLGTAT